MAEKVQTEQEELETTKIEAVKSIFKGATAYTDEVFTTAVENLKNERKRSNEQTRTPENKIRRTNPTESPSMATTSLYMDSSPDSSYDEEEFIKTKNHNYYIDYFPGPGDPEWQLNEHSIRWVVNEVDISERCVEYRSIAVKKSVFKAVDLNATEELALSHIFVFHEESSHGLCEYFDDEMWDELFAEFRKLYPYELIPEKVSDLSENIIKIACEKQSRRERQSTARRYLRNIEITTNEEEIMVEIFRDLIDNEQSSFTQNNFIEDTHTIKNVTPIITRPFFKNSRKIIFEGANKMTESSAIAKRNFDPVLLGMKPDFMVKTTNPSKHVELLIGEIKPPKPRNALVSEDLISLGKMMKCALDKSINDGVDDLVICGLQVIGFLGRAYVMDLQFDGIYRLILIGEFELPRGSTSWGTVLQCYQVINTIRMIVDNNATLYQSVIRMNTKQTKSEKIKMTKPMFHTPIKIPI